MNFTNSLIELQHKRIDGPFERVTYIPPDHSLLKFPSSTLGNYSILGGIFLLLCSPIFVIAGQHSESENPLLAIPNALISILLELPPNILTASRISVSIYLTAFFITVGIGCLLCSKIINRRVIVKRWKMQAKKVRAKIIDSEIQNRSIIRSTGPMENNHHVTPRYSSVWEYRLKVLFNFSGKEYVATPSVVNRINPGTIGVHFPSEDGCRKELKMLGDEVNLEINRDNPLDCEIEGHIGRYDGGTLKYLGVFSIFVAAVALFAWFFTYLMEHGHNYT